MNKIADWDDEFDWKTLEDTCVDEYTESESYAGAEAWESGFYQFFDLPRISSAAQYFLQ